MKNWLPLVLGVVVAGLSAFAIATEPSGYCGVAAARRIPGLIDLPLDDPVEDHAVEEVLLRQEDEAVDCDGGALRIEGDVERSERGVDGGRVRLGGADDLGRLLELEGVDPGGRRWGAPCSDSGTVGGSMLSRGRGLGPGDQV